MITSTSIFLPEGIAMALLSIVFVFLLARYTVAARWLHRDDVVASLLNAFAARKPNSWLAFAVLPLGGAVLLAVIWWSLDFWLSFFFGVLLLLYSVGRGDCPPAPRGGAAPACGPLLTSFPSLRSGRGWSGP